MKMTFDQPWKVSVNKTDVLQIQLCNQEFPADLIPHTDSEGCLDLLQYVPLQNYESEITFIFMITVFAIIVMVILLANHIKDLVMNS